MSHNFKVVSVMVVLAIGGCASLPNGPNVMVLPGAGVPFEHFRNDDALCEQYAFSQISGKTTNSATAPDPSTGATSGSADEIQQRYDVAYVQCMYAKGHQVPISGQFSGVIPHSTVAPTMNIPPPPPAGTPPPPPGAPLGNSSK